MSDAPRTTPQGRPRGWNLRASVQLECPQCGRTKWANRDPSDPPRTAKVLAHCDRCPGEDNGEVGYFDAEGREIDLEGEPL